ncbi:Ppx/GppA phosphatase family protein [Phaeodactylibacter luteus]|uniref:Ppx/GppA phosphatase N-terminal domain-containing protein n=1 Tax=Phaeodactylibacter luteus TaxID=1564516 RepID=A0A5C6RIY8_9BACT|nr:hypothetical protein [Phaeodactylibacter luteus]TXB61895.1 hypothetical protein FRY97_16735 [Phaeodactylibacter luteus]
MDIAPNFAVLDLGTNTFHLLIARPQAGTPFETVLEEKRYVFLAEEGIARIGEGARNRARKALHEYAALLDEHKVDRGRVRISGTAALRTASNGPQLQAEAKGIIGAAVQIISGKEEARLIHLGVSAALYPMQERALIMDIGGGSTEFILSDGRSGALWAESFPIGAAVLFREFHHTEPIEPAQTAALRAHLQATLQPLKRALKAHPCTVLVGASGAFEVVGSVLGSEAAAYRAARLPIAQFPEFARKIAGMTAEERQQQMPDIPAQRAQLMTVAFLLIGMVMEMAGTNALFVAAYGLKEGMMQELISEGRQASSM